MFYDKPVRDATDKEENQMWEGEKGIINTKIYLNTPDQSKDLCLCFTFLNSETNSGNHLYD